GRDPLGAKALVDLSRRRVHGPLYPHSAKARHDAFAPTGRKPAGGGGMRGSTSRGSRMYRRGTPRRLGTPEGPRGGLRSWATAIRCGSTSSHSASSGTGRWLGTVTGVQGKRGVSACRASWIPSSLG